jgi:hypothetical protein
LPRGSDQIASSQVAASRQGLIVNAALIGTSYLLSAQHRFIDRSSYVPKVVFDALQPQIYKQD